MCVANFGHSRFALGIALSRPSKVLLKLVSSWHLVCNHILAPASFTVCFFFFFLTGWFHYDHYIEWLCFSGHGKAGLLYKVDQDQGK